MQAYINRQMNISECLDIIKTGTIEEIAALAAFLSTIKGGDNLMATLTAQALKDIDK